MRIAAIERRVGELNGASFHRSTLTPSFENLATLDGMPYPAARAICSARYPPTEGPAARHPAEAVPSAVAALTRAGTLDPQLDPEIPGMAGTSIAAGFPKQRVGRCAAFRGSSRSTGRSRSGGQVSAGPVRRSLLDEAVVDATSTTRRMRPAPWRGRGRSGSLDISTGCRSCRERAALTSRWPRDPLENSATRTHADTDAPFGRTIFHQRTLLPSRRDVSIEREFGAMPPCGAKFPRREGGRPTWLALPWRPATAISAFTFGTHLVRVGRCRAEIVLAGIVPKGACRSCRFRRHAVPQWRPGRVWRCLRRVRTHGSELQHLPSFPDGENAYCSRGY
jgi:hypothetical protein